MHVIQQVELLCQFDPDALARARQMALLQNEYEKTDGYEENNINFLEALLGCYVPLLESAANRLIGEASQNRSKQVALDVHFECDQGK